jgi:hypothetical protein
MSAAISSPSARPPPSPHPSSAVASPTFGFLSTALAMAMRCFWPPLSCSPRSPTCVLKPSGRRSMKTRALAARAAACGAQNKDSACLLPNPEEGIQNVGCTPLTCTSSSVAPGLPIAMFSRTVQANSVGSWLTRPT